MKSEPKALLAAINSIDAPEDWEVKQNAEGKWTAQNAWSRVVVDSVEMWSLFKRNGIHLALGPNGRQEKTRFLVGSLDNVKVYLRKGPDGVVEILLTKEDLYP